MGEEYGGGAGAAMTELAGALNENRQSTGKHPYTNVSPGDDVHQCR